jgi:hypothetical protein
VNEATPSPLSTAQIRNTVAEIVSQQPVSDLHTHLYPPTFGTPVANRSHPIDPQGLMLWGIDELVTYHYLIAEVFRVVPASKLPYEAFWKMSKPEQADHIWKHLFVERTPISEACRGVITTLTKLGLDPRVKNLASVRKWFAEQDPNEYIDRVMELAGVDSITMTNPVFDDNERERWLKGITPDRRFPAVLRIDSFLRDWPTAGAKLAAWGYQTRPEVTNQTVEEARRFLRDWIERMKPLYLSLSLPPEFRYPNTLTPRDQAGTEIMARVVMPICREYDLPFAMMIGSRLRVNPQLRDAGDMVGRADIDSVVNICHEFSDNRFLVTMLSRENQHELAVAARKFGNLMVFGCWWFVNNPSLIEEITRMRLELLGTSFIPQHSDARILDQLIYKWSHSRQIIAQVLADKYEDLIAAGWPVTRDAIQNDVRLLLRDNFRNFVKHSW